MTERDELERANRLIARMAAENQLVRAENTRLRRLAVNRGRGRTLSYALVDARALLAWRWSGLAISRRACEGYGMPVRRWEWARRCCWLPECSTSGRTMWRAAMTTSATPSLPSSERLSAWRLPATSADC